MFVVKGGDSQGEERQKLQHWGISFSFRYKLKPAFIQLQEVCCSLCRQPGVSGFLLYYSKGQIWHLTITGSSGCISVVGIHCLNMNLNHYPAFCNVYIMICLWKDMPHSDKSLLKLWQTGSFIWPIRGFSSQTTFLFYKAIFSLFVQSVSLLSYSENIFTPTTKKDWVVKHPLLTETAKSPL